MLLWSPVFIHVCVFIYWVSNLSDCREARRGVYGVSVCFMVHIPLPTILCFSCTGISGRQWRDEWRDFYDPGRGGEGGEPGKRAREELEACLMASQKPPMDQGGFQRNVRHRWGAGGGPRGPRMLFPGPPAPGDRGGPRGPLPPHENPFAYNRKFARGRRN